MPSQKSGSKPVPPIRSKSILAVLFILFAGLSIFVACEKEEELNITPIKIKGMVHHVTAYQGNDGIIDIMVTGGIPPYTFHWSNNDTTEDIVNLSAGIYIVEVTDVKNHLRRDTFEVKEPDPIPLSVSFDVTHPSTSEAEDGSVHCEVTGGYPPFTYLWSNGAKTATVENLGADTYVFTVTDSIGQVLTDSVSLTGSAPVIEKVTDIEGNTYDTVQIGDQVWLKENLRVTLAPDSSEITSYVYEDDMENEKIYGRLYTWDVAMNNSTEEKARGICPEGWHIPSDEEFKQLEMHLGMTPTEADLENTWRGENVGTKLKIGGSSGFDLLLSGRRTASGNFGLLGRVEYLWTSTEFGEDYAWRRCFDKFANDVGRWNTFPKSYAFSVRCIKNE